MTDKEKIRAEIERELSAHDKVDHLEAFEVGKAWNRGHRGALENILSFIDSLPEEPVQKESDDLDGAIDAEITKDIHNLLHVKSDVLPMPSEYKYGDKVKIIIIKDDEQNGEVY